MKFARATRPITDQDVAAKIATYTDENVMQLRKRSLNRRTFIM